MHKALSLSIVIPVRSNENLDLLQRLKWKTIPVSEKIEVILVDDGSKDSTELEKICTESHWNYLGLKTQDASFSLSRARNAGIKASNAQYIYFEDADFLHKSNFL